MGSPYPAPPPPPPYPYRRRRSFIWPLLLIAIGVVFLLQNLGLLSWQVWGSLWRYWPAVLILIGLEMFLGSRAHGGILIAGLLVLAIVAALVAGLANHFGSTVAASPADNQTRTTAQALQDARSADVQVHYGPGSLNIGPLPNAGSQLAQMTYDGPPSVAPSTSYRVRGGIGDLTYALRPGPNFHPPFFGGSAPGGSGHMDLLLNPDIPLTLDIQEGASNGQLDLRQMHVSKLQLQTGASNTALTLPSQAGLTTASIKGGAATIDVQVPDGVAAQIQYEGGLSTLTVDTSRFPTTDNQIYRSPDYDSATNKVDLTIQAGVAHIKVR